MGSVSPDNLCPSASVLELAIRESASDRDKAMLDDICVGHMRQIAALKDMEQTVNVQTAIMRTEDAFAASLRAIGDRVLRKSRYDKQGASGGVSGEQIDPGFYRER